jgi:peroxiredoxin (alkyl hydroperoxide reductase subunit C)
MDSYFSVHLPRINEPAPDFRATTTQGERKLSDYAGKWLILFSHPADFTPVCTTEFVAFAKSHDKFQALGCELLGLSLDSTYAHLAWIRNIKENFAIDIPFPIIADVSKKVAHEYGMIQSPESEVSTVRATFFIDPESIVRAIVYYPMATGRSIDELLRLLAALQTSDRHGVVTPEGWQPGDKVIVPPPATVSEAEARESAGYDYTDWYLSKKKV